MNTGVQGKYIMSTVCDYNELLVTIVWDFCECKCFVNIYMALT